MTIQEAFKLLGVNEGASQDEIKRAYRAMAKKYHPDKHSDPVAKELAQDKMTEINMAYEMIERGYGDGDSSGPFGNQYRGPFGGSSTGGNSESNYNNPWEHQQEWYERRTYQQRQPNMPGGQPSCCNTLCCLCALDGCCECLGRDLICCC